VRKFFSTRVHGVLDYLSVVVLFAAPRLLGWDERLVQIGTVAAILTLASSLLTRYELGLFKAIPMRGHLTVDFLLGAAFLLLAFGLTEEPSAVRWALGAFGAFCIVAALATDTEPGLRGVPAPAGDGNARVYPQ
jgi:hypothetical protein